jgi:DNA-binding response OmpR family regulator
MTTLLQTIPVVKKHILVVDDNINLHNQIIEYFTQQQYVVSVTSNSDTVLRMCTLTKYDCILLGMTAPRINSVSFIQQLRQRSSVPVVVISARRDEYEKIHALQMGADDYLYKPTNLLELDARITAILRRISATRQSISTPYLQLDAGNRSVLINGQVIEVTPMEFAIISTMMTAPGRVFSRKELTALMFGEQFSIGRAIDVHISNIRNKIEPNPNKSIYIVTVYGKGYMYQERTFTPAQN